MPSRIAAGPATGLWLLMLVIGDLVCVWGAGDRSSPLRQGGAIAVLAMYLWVAQGECESGLRPCVTVAREHRENVRHLQVARSI
jgi:hypothetical protein